MNKTKAIERLQSLLAEVSVLKHEVHDSRKFRKWRRNTIIAIEHIFGKESSHVSEFSGICYSPVVLFSGGRTDFHDAYVHGLDSATALLESVIEEIREYWADDDVEPIGYEVPGDRKRSNEVFVVHGRDDGTKNTVARFLEDLGLVPIILHEQPDQGRTVIEKFEQHAQVDFVVAPLTPDDVGALRGSEKDLKLRWRWRDLVEPAMMRAWRFGEKRRPTTFARGSGAGNARPSPAR